MYRLHSTSTGKEDDIFNLCFIIVINITTVWYWKYCSRNESFFPKLLYFSVNCGVDLKGVYDVTYLVRLLKKSKR